MIILILLLILFNAILYYVIYLLKIYIIPRVLNHLLQRREIFFSSKLERLIKKLLTCISLYLFVVFHIYPLLEQREQYSYCYIDIKLH